MLQQNHPSESSEMLFLQIMSVAFTAVELGFCVWILFIYLLILSKI